MSVGSSASDQSAEFFDASIKAMEAEHDDGALDALGWWEMLGSLDDDDAASAVFAAARAQGRTLADTPLVCGVSGAALAAAAGLAPGAAVAALCRRSPERGEVWNIVGHVGGRSLIFDVEGRGAFVVPSDEVSVTSIDVAGRATVVEVIASLGGRSPDLAEGVAAPLRARSLYLARAAAASEILGAAERVAAMATDYARDRHQFGKPIGTFQALRHLLAWAATDCVAIDSVVRQAISLRHDAGSAELVDRFGAATKAVAGRNGRRACDRALQAFGGIGFTAEHEHHHFHSRVMVLDALLGTSAVLTGDLGAWLRAGGTPSVPDLVLGAAVRSGVVQS